MLYMRVAMATVEVLDHKSLKEAWKQHGGPLSFVASFVVRKPLTASQRRRLPAGLAKRVKEPISKASQGADQLKKEAYTVPEVAAMTGYSRQTITTLFEEEPGVLILSRPEKMHKRGYRSIRIPNGVYERVLIALATRARPKHGVEE